MFRDVIVTEGECVCVELVAHDRYRSNEAVLFLGSIRYDVLKKLYDSRCLSTWNWAQKLMANTTKCCYEFVKMRGPRGKGFAEMAIARVASCGFETPMSERGFDFNSRVGDSFQNQKQRRMSETNLFNRMMLFGGGGGSGGGGGAGSRRTAVTPGSKSTRSSAGTPAPAFRNRRWQSDSDNVNGNVIDTRSVDGDESTTTIIADTKNHSGISNNATWSVRTLTDALQFLREKPESVPLNAFLTYITLPYHEILEGW